MRCLLPKSLLDHGFFPSGTANKDGNGKCKAYQICDFSWSGQRRIPSYIDKLVFPEDFLTALRTIAMREDELFKVSSLLEEVQFLFGNIFSSIECFAFHPLLADWIWNSLPIVPLILQLIQSAFACLTGPYSFLV